MLRGDHRREQEQESVASTVAPAVGTGDSGSRGNGSDNEPKNKEEEEKGRNAFGEEVDDKPVLMTQTQYELDQQAMREAGGLMSLAQRQDAVACDAVLALGALQASCPSTRRLLLQLLTPALSFGLDTVCVRASAADTAGSNAAQAVTTASETLSGENQGSKQQQLQQPGSRGRGGSKAARGGSDVGGRGRSGRKSRGASTASASSRAANVEAEAEAKAKEEARVHALRCRRCPPMAVLEWIVRLSMGFIYTSTCFWADSHRTELRARCKEQRRRAEVASEELQQGTIPNHAAAAAAAAWAEPQPRYQPGRMLLSSVMADTSALQEQEYSSSPASSRAAAEVNSMGGMDGGPGVEDDSDEGGEELQVLGHYIRALVAESRRNGGYSATATVALRPITASRNSISSGELVVALLERVVLCCQCLPTAQTASTVSEGVPPKATVPPTDEELEYPTTPIPVDDQPRVACQLALVLALLQLMLQAAPGSVSTTITGTGFLPSLIDLGCGLYAGDATDISGDGRLNNTRNERWRQLRVWIQLQTLRLLRPCAFTAAGDVLPGKPGGGMLYKAPLVQAICSSPHLLRPFVVSSLLFGGPTVEAAIVSSSPRSTVEAAVIATTIEIIQALVKASPRVLAEVLKLDGMLAIIRLLAAPSCAIWLQAMVGAWLRAMAANALHGHKVEASLLWFLPPAVTAVLLQPPPAPTAAKTAVGTESETAASVLPWVVDKDVRSPTLIWRADTMAPRFRTAVTAAIASAATIHQSTATPTRMMATAEGGRQQQNKDVIKVQQLKARIHAAMKQGDAELASAYKDKLTELLQQQQHQQHQHQHQHHHHHHHHHHHQDVVAAARGSGSVAAVGSATEAQTQQQGGVTFTPSAPPVFAATFPELEDEPYVGGVYLREFLRAPHMFYDASSGESNESNRATVIGGASGAGGVMEPFVEALLQAHAAYCSGRQVGAAAVEEEVRARAMGTICAAALTAISIQPALADHLVNLGYVEQLLELLDTEDYEHYDGNGDDTVGDGGDGGGCYGRRASLKLLLMICRHAPSEGCSRIARRDDSVEALKALLETARHDGGGGNSDAIPVDDKLTKEEVLEALVGLVNTAAPLERMDLVKQLDKVGIVEHLITEIVDRKAPNALAVGKAERMNAVRLLQAMTKVDATTHEATTPRAVAAKLSQFRQWQEFLGASHELYVPTEAMVAPQAAETMLMLTCGGSDKQVDRGVLTPDQETSS